MKERQNGGNGKELTWRGLIDVLMVESNGFFKDRSWANSHMACLRRNADFDTPVYPDVARFIVDRVREKPELTRRFGRTEIDIPQASILLSSLSEKPRAKLAGELKQKIYLEYPFIRKIIRNQKKLNSSIGIPPHIFWQKLEELFPDLTQREAIERCLEKAKCQFAISPTEYAIMIKVIKGKTSKEISQDLNISNFTMEHHFRTLFSKLDGTRNYLCEEIDGSKKKRVRNQVKQTAILTALKEELYPAFLFFRIPLLRNLVHIDSLTEKEQKVLALLKEGLSNPEVGRRLGIPTQIVKSRLTTVFAKTGCHSRVEASILYYVASLQQAQA